MGINVNDLRPDLRARVLAAAARQSAAEAEAAAARRAHHAVGAVPAAERPEQPPALVGDRARAAAGARSRGERYRVEFVAYACRPCDWDNLAGSVKEIQDAMVDAGWLPGDDWDVLEGGVASRKCAHKAEQRVEATLTRLA